MSHLKKQKFLEQYVECEKKNNNRSEVEKIALNAQFSFKIEFKKDFKKAVLNHLKLKNVQ